VVIIVISIDNRGLNARWCLPNLGFIRLLVHPNMFYVSEKSSSSSGVGNLFYPASPFGQATGVQGVGGREVNLPEQFSLCFFSHKLQRQLWINEGRQPSAKNMPRSPSSQWLRRPAIASVVLPRTTTLDSRRLRLERVNCSVTAASWVRRRTGQQCTISRQT